jgi:hypothetical protein
VDVAGVNHCAGRGDWPSTTAVAAGRSAIAVPVRWRTSWRGGNQNAVAGVWRACKASEQLTVDRQPAKIDNRRMSKDINRNAARH